MPDERLDAEDVRAARPRPILDDGPVVHDEPLDDELVGDEPLEPELGSQGAEPLEPELGPEADEDDLGRQATKSSGRGPRRTSPRSCRRRNCPWTSSRRRPTRSTRLPLRGLRDEPPAEDPLADAPDFRDEDSRERDRPDAPPREQGDFDFDV